MYVLTMPYDMKDNGTFFDTWSTWELILLTLTGKMLNDLMPPRGNR